MAPPSADVRSTSTRRVPRLSAAAEAAASAVAAAVVDEIAEIAVAVAVAGAAAAAGVVAVEGETSTREYIPEEVTRPRLMTRPGKRGHFPPQWRLVSRCCWCSTCARCRSTIIFFGFRCLGATLTLMLFPPPM